MANAFVRTLLAALAATQLAGCYVSRSMASQDVRPDNGIWHVEYAGAGSEAQDYRVDFLNNGGVIVYDGEVTHDLDGRKVTQNTTPILFNPLFEDRNHWSHGKVVLHTVQDFGNFLIVREYKFAVQDAHQIVGEVSVITRVSGIYTRANYRAIAKFVKAYP